MSLILKPQRTRVSWGSVGEQVIPKCQMLSPISRGQPIREEEMELKQLVADRELSGCLMVCLAFPLNSAHCEPEKACKDQDFKRNNVVCCQIYIEQTCSIVTVENNNFKVIF